jgi:hypothetical protein
MLQYKLIDTVYMFVITKASAITHVETNHDRYIKMLIPRKAIILMHHCLISKTLPY